MITLHDGVPVPKVIDFGIAKATQADLTDKTIYTQYNQFIGTPAYMSPEQAEMSGLDIDTRADIYSLGVLLYELLCGTTPFDGRELLNSGVDEMRKIIREREPLRPSTKLSQTLNDAGRAKHKGASQADDAKRLRTRERITEIRGDLDWVVMKCLEKDRSRRYETANGLVADIRRHLANEPVGARPPSAAYKFQKAWKRNKLVYSASIAVIIALTAGIKVSTIQALRALREKGNADLARIDADISAVEAKKAQERAEQLQWKAAADALTARQQAYAADMLLCNRALAANNLRQARQLLDRHRPEKGKPDLRGWEWRHLWQRCRSGALFQLGRDNQRVLKALYSKAGRTAIAYTDGGKVTRWNLARRQPEADVQVKSPPTTVLMSSSGYLCASADRERFAAVGMNRAEDYMIRIWEAGGKPVAEFSIGDSFPTAVSIAPDGASVAVFHPRESAATIWDVPSGEKRAELKGPPSVPRQYMYHGYVRHSHDGGMLAIGGLNGVSLETPPGALKKNLKFLSDGNTIGLVEQVLDTGEARLRLWSAPTWEEIEAAKAKQDER